MKSITVWRNGFEDTYTLADVADTPRSDTRIEIGPDPFLDTTGDTTPPFQESITGTPAIHMVGVLSCPAQTVELNWRGSSGQLQTLKLES